MDENELDVAVARWQGTPPESVAELFATCYPALKRIAHNRLYAANLRRSFATESLLHESFLKLATASAERFLDKSHFFAYASKMMRNIIVDAVREANAQRRGSGQGALTLDTEIANLCPAASDVSAIDDALKDLQSINPCLAALVEMRFFAGLTEPEVAQALDVSERTVRREWVKARAALLVLLEGERI